MIHHDLMSDDLIAWDDQRAFLAVLESGSLSAAARRLGMAQPTVRRRIAALEAALGVALFTRSLNGLAPTAQARDLAGYARAMAAASDAFLRAASARDGTVEGTVRVAVSEFVGVAVLPPMLAALQRRHPALRIEIAPSNASADMLGQEADVAVRMHPPQQGALVARHVGAIPLKFFAHRDYLARRGRPGSLADLPSHDLVGPDRAGADRALVRSVLPGLPPGAFAVRTDSHAAQYAAIRAGLGIGAIQEPVGLADPDLEPVLPDLVVHRLDTWIVTHEDLRGTPRVAAVFDHLVAAFLAFSRAR
jgi:DNA-binding transcriptional LysR family regulator